MNRGVSPLGTRRIQFDFEFEGVRYRPTLERAPTEANLRRARLQLQGMGRGILQQFGKAAAAQGGFKVVVQALGNGCGNRSWFSKRSDCQRMSCCSSR